ncbi:SubName: Full=Uncharacterized protein {ECO:0000313/EMBL:CCA66667.1} [Serendipita indica DSM 11827]|nr:SubName: Full=Uncharacterized protein {ECO:0000313/EMBL:CCA66667.1} [Serendipita indica DSM 11827]
MGLLSIPEISVTLAPDSTSSQDSPVGTNTVSLIVHGPRLVVPPRPADCPSRRSLAQRGLRIGSFRLNCAESVTTSPTSPTLSRPPADLASTRRVFNWARTSTPFAQPNTMQPTRSHRGHSRAKSLNSFADVNDSLKMNIGPPRHPAREVDSRPMSIDLSVLCAKPNSPTCHDFASAL